MAELSANAYTLAGLLGVAFYLLGYAALQLGFLRGSGYMYTLLNLAGASFVLISLATDFNLASALIQVSWITISFVGLLRMYLRNRNLSFTREEEALLRTRMPRLPKLSARAFFNAGGWVDVPEGEKLLVEMAPVGHLFYLSEGLVSVCGNGQEITQLQSGFLGEINVVDGAPASATVSAEAPSRVFVIAREALKDLFAKDVEFKSALQASLSREMGQRLMRANRKIIGATEVEAA